MLLDYYTNALSSLFFTNTPLISCMLTLHPSAHVQMMVKNRINNFRGPDLLTRITDIQRAGSVVRLHETGFTLHTTHLVTISSSISP